MKKPHDETVVEPEPRPPARSCGDRDRSQQPLAQGLGHGFRLGVGLELAVDFSDVEAHRVGADTEAVGRGLIGIASGEAADVDRAVRAARAAFTGPWSKWTAYGRQELLFRAHAMIDARFQELAEIEAMDMGAPISKVLASKAGLQRFIAFFASQAQKTR